MLRDPSYPSVDEMLLFRAPSSASCRHISEAVRKRPAVKLERGRAHSADPPKPMLLLLSSCSIDERG